jgi:phosphoribosylformylglycinamidine synthase
VKVRVTIGFRPGVLDPEAVAIHRSLKGLGFETVEGVRKEKVIELELASTDRARAEEEVRAMCEKLLANPVIESYAIALEG